MKIKVLMIVPNLRVSNGVASFAMNYFRVLEHDKVGMDFAVYKNIESPYYDEIIQKGCKVHILPDCKRLSKHIKECKSILESEKYDVVHDNTLINSLPLMSCAKKAGVPVRLLHGHSSRMGETKIREARNKLFFPLLRGTATNYAACSEASAQLMFENNCWEWIPNIVLDNTVLFSEEKREKLRREAGVEDKVIIGTVGRTTSAKNPLFALDVMKEVVERNKNVEYWWVGNGMMDEQVEERIESIGLKEIKKYESTDRISDIYHIVDVFFLPSIFEGLPITIIEAQAMGLPCVISDAITEEVVFTDLVNPVSLKQPISKWTQEIEKQLEHISERRSRVDELRNSAFSSLNAGRNLYEYYLRLLNEERKTM